MSRTVQVLIGLAALMVLLIGGIWLLGAVQTARSPEYQCQKIVDDLRSDPRYANSSEAAFEAGYQACLRQKRGH